MAAWIPTIEAQAERPLLQMGRLAREHEEEDALKVNGFIAVIESRIFLQECIRRSMQSAFSLPILTCSTLSELELGLKAASAAIVIVSWVDGSNEVNTNVLNALSELVPNVPVVVLAQTNDVDLARTAIRHGAKGYIPCTLRFDITIEAVRFVLAGGTYVPMDCVLATGPGVQVSPASRPSRGVTARELAVIRALQQGKSNKVIAYELNMCESTVKVHVRNLMKKMKAKNRTDLAIKTQSALQPQSAPALTAQRVATVISERW
jgi:DNA-binding NarL/FixJ family response regulator